MSEEDIACENQSMKTEVLKLLNKYRSVCWKPNEPLGEYQGDAMQIQLKDKTTIINKRPYPIPHSKQAQLQEVITDMLKTVVITKSKSSYNSPLIVVAKPNNEIRPCVDYRLLNEATVDTNYPMPKIGELMHSIQHMTHITKLDLAQAYHQCKMADDSKPLTAFTFNNTLFQFERVPFGLKGSPAYFSRVINTVLYDLIGNNLLAYMDDIIVFSKNESEHLEKLEAVIQKLSEANLKMKIIKCRFFAPQITFLGYKICLLYTSPSPRDKRQSRMPSSA